MSWFDDNELSSGADAIGWNSLKKKKISKKFGHIEINKIKAKAKKKKKRKRKLTIKKWPKFKKKLKKREKPSFIKRNQSKL